MKIIKDNITAIEASNQNSNWPLQNTRNNYPESYVEFLKQTETITTTLGKPPIGANALYIGYTNASQGTVTCKKASDDQVIFTKSINLTTYDYYNYVTSSAPFKQNQAWLDYTDPQTEHKLEIELSTTSISTIKVLTTGTGYQAGTFVLSSPTSTNCTGRYNVDSAGSITEFIIEDKGLGFTATNGIVTGSTLTLSNPGSGTVLTTEIQSMLRIGIIRAGNAVRRRNPTLGLSEGLKDLGTYLKHNDGTEYIVPGRILRSFSGTINLHNIDSIDVQNELIELRRNPAAINLLDTDSSYICFGKVTTLPAMKRNALLRKQLNFTIQEV